MSSVICKRTGIIMEVSDNMGDASDEGMLFFMHHPLAQYNQVRKTFTPLTGVKHSKHNNNSYKQSHYLPILAGSLLTILRHHELLQIHDEEQAIWANSIICQQARSNGQILNTIHRLLASESKLKLIKEGFQVRGEVRKRQYKFCLEACMLQGQEREGLNKHFLSNLLEWVNTLIGVKETAVIIPSKRAELDIAIGAISIDDKTKLNALDGIIFDELLEVVKNNIEDRVYRSIKRVPIKDIKRKLVDMVRLMRDYSILSASQTKKLSAMVRNEVLISKILTCVVDMLYTYALAEVNITKRNKAFEVAAWLKASDVEFQRRGLWATTKAEVALGEVLISSMDKPKESLVARLKRIKAKKGSKV